MILTVKLEIPNENLCRLEDNNYQELVAQACRVKALIKIQEFINEHSREIFDSKRMGETTKDPSAGESPNYPLKCASKGEKE